MNELTHTDSSGKAKMVDVTSKSENERTASAKATVYLNSKVFELIKNNGIQKGDVLTVAKIAGIQGAKKTSELIPLCHNIFISNIDINFILNNDDYSIEIISTAKTVASTGIEMEALTAVSIAALTIYDMCKAVDKSITVGGIKLISKTGGKNGEFAR
jgi:molybdenum cofactor biosynthesis protein MoaC